MSDFLRSPDGRFRGPTPTARFALQAPARGEATGDLDWLDRALAGARKRARAVNGPASEPEPPTPASPEPSPPAGKMIPAGPHGSPPSGDPLRDAIRRYRR